MPADPEKVAGTIRELRQDLSLTQVQLASEIGITPTSIYRYEAGSSAPDTATLIALWNVALRRGSPTAVKFSEVLVSMVEPLRPMIEAMSAVQGNLASSIGTDLTADERVTTLALLKFLRSSPEPTLRTILETILGPFIAQVRADFSKQLKEESANASSKKNDAKESRRKSRS